MTTEKRSWIDQHVGWLMPLLVMALASWLLATWGGGKRWAARFVRLAQTDCHDSRKPGVILHVRADWAVFEAKMAER